jgi:hypothetical protein
MLTGRIAFAIVAFGGFSVLATSGLLYPGRSWCGLPRKKKFVVDMPTNVFKTAPGMNKDTWAEEINFDWLAKCYLHYGLAPYWDSSLSPDEQIKGLAYAIWQREEEPEASADRHYYRAERILSVQGVVGSSTRKLQNSNTTIEK